MSKNTAYFGGNPIIVNIIDVPDNYTLKQRLIFLNSDNEDTMKLWENYDTEGIRKVYGRDFGHAMRNDTKLVFRRHHSTKDRSLTKLRENIARSSYTSNKKGGNNDTTIGGDDDIDTMLRNVTIDLELGHIFGSTEELKKGGSSTLKKGGSSTLKKGGSSTLKKGGSSTLKKGGSSTLKKGGDDDLDFINDSNDNDIDDISNLLYDDNEAPAPTYRKDTGTTVITDIYITPDDSISEFKHKIFAVTGIPAYRQHIWYGNNVTPLGYKILYNGPMHINIKNIYASGGLYEGLPIDMYWYNIKNELEVISLDNIQLLEHIYNKGIVEYFVSDLSDFINPIRRDIENIIRKDSYSSELIYYSFVMKYWPMITLTVFGEYVSNESSISDIYPDLSPKRNVMTRMFHREKKILQDILSDEGINAHSESISTSITRCVLSVTNEYVYQSPVVYLRNLFDMFELSPSINFIICNTEIDGQPLVLTKSYLNTMVPSTKIGPNTMLFNVKLNEENRASYMRLILNKNCTYRVDSIWSEDRHYTSDKIYDMAEKSTNMVVSQINACGNSAVTYPLCLMTKANSTFSNLNVSIFWKHTISSKTFESIDNQMLDYVSAGILSIGKKNASSSNYYVLKGMSKYDPLNYRLQTHNQFQYLTDKAYKEKYDRFLIHTKKMSVSHRFTDVKIELTGLKEQEYFKILVYILKVLNSAVIHKHSDKESSNVKKLKSLKEKDPVLYEFKKLYNSPIVYAKLCQQQKQPQIYTEPGKNRVKYWNFTENKPVYYGCPYTTYPYINFITHAHPRNYCIPCCYKLPPSTALTGKGKIYSECLEKKEYSKVKSSTTKSRYVTSYNRFIEVGRLSKLPENTLEAMFYESFSVGKKGIDDECTKERGFYLYGVPQNMNNVSYVGFLFCISHALNMNIIRFVNESIDKILANKSSWNTINNGHIVSEYSDVTGFVSDLRETFVGDKVSTTTKWNDVFISITEIYWGVTVRKFVDGNGGVYLSTNDSINHADDFISIDKHIVVVENNNIYYPVYVVHRDEFFSIGDIKQKIFEHDAPLIQLINEFAVHHINSSIADTRMDLFGVKSLKSLGYIIDTLFINKSNRCYGVLLKTEASKFYLSITGSMYILDNTNVSYDLVDIKYMPTIEVVMTLFDTINAKGTSRITVNNLLKHRGRIIGLTYNNVSTYVSPVQTLPKSMRARFENLRYYDMKYDPHEVNKSIYNKVGPKLDTRQNKLSECLYNHFLYQILIIMFIDIVSNATNKSMRKKIITLVGEHRSKEGTYIKMSELLKDYPTDLKVIRQILHKDNIVDVINNSRFAFDKFALSKMKKKEHKELVAELTELYSQHTINGVPDFTKAFPNILSTCQETNIYCHGKKLVIKKQRLEELLDILASDILNPVKSNFLFSPVFARNIINNLQFIIRPHENIRVIV
jgi:hypothetical protein